MTEHDANDAVDIPEAPSTPTVTQLLLHLECCMLASVLPVTEGDGHARHHQPDSLRDQKESEQGPQHAKTSKGKKRNGRLSLQKGGKEVLVTSIP